MKTSSNGLDLIKQFEGCKLKAYQDSGGVWTVGYGATGPQINSLTTWTQDQANYALQGRIDAIDGILRTYLATLLTQNQWDALVSLAYNIGQGALRGSTLLKRVNQREWELAALEFLKWDHVGGAVNQGLLNRRQAEAKLFQTP